MSNPVVLITGALTGIGRATALAFADEGARVVVSGRRDDAGEKLIAELRGLGAEAEFIRADVRHEQDVQNLVDKTVARFGRLDVAVNNAGTEGKPGPLTEQTPDSYAAMFDTNVLGTLLSMKYELRAMQKQGAGSIVNVSSGISFSALPGTGAYSASKAGLNMLSAVARAELGSEGIAVSTMYPFVTATEFIDSVRAGQEAASQLESSHAPQPQAPEQVADAILDLIRTGAEQADLVPEQFGGSFKG